MDFKKDELNRLREENAVLSMKVSALEGKIDDLNKIIDDYKAKEASISNAIVFAVDRSNQLEASRKKLYQLDIQRSRLLYMRMEQVINELYARYPELKKDSKMTEMANKFKQAIYSQNEFTSADLNYAQSNIKEDPIRKLLNNIINYIDDEKKTKTIKRADKLQTNIAQTPARTNIPQNRIPESSSGFDLNEALHPKESLEEILKAFDLGDKKKKKT